MRSHRRYKNPPIEEALCEFHFQSEQDWDPTIPGKLHTEVGDKYAGKPRQQKVVDVGLQIQKDKPPNLSYGEGLARVQLVTENGKRMVGVGQNVLSIHMLRPYQDPQHPKHSGWDEFQSRIKQVLDTYWKVAEPKGISRIGIRYINKIVIPQPKVEVNDYLKCAPPDVIELPDRMKNYGSRVEYFYDDEVRLVLSNGLINPPMNDIGLILDLDVIWEDVVPVAQDEALRKTEDLRNRERDAFEAVITDKTRELFDAE